ncbi:MAG: aldehyde dehydrogenase family protein, partial [Bacteroidia bacterium]|nr:aldehyde dehydrogenase family protein [Bacteroidia bacterium]
KLTAKRLVWGKFLNAGQTCIAPDYIIVHHQIKSKLIEAIKFEITKAYGQDPEKSEDYARVINARNFERLSRILDESEICLGGQQNAASNYIAPTLIDNPEIDSFAMQDEIFGPVLPLFTFETEDDIDRIVTYFEKPLSFYVFSKNSKFSKRMTQKYSFGGGVINDTMVHFGNHRLPFGGVGESGMGAYHGRHGFETFSHKKPIVKKANWLDFPIRYAPYKGKLKALKFFFKWLS